MHSALVTFFEIARMVGNTPCNPGWGGRKLHVFDFLPGYIRWSNAHTCRTQGLMNPSFCLLECYIVSWSHCSNRMFLQRSVKNLASILIWNRIPNISPQAYLHPIAQWQDSSLIWSARIQSTLGVGREGIRTGTFFLQLCVRAFSTESERSARSSM